MAQNRVMAAKHAAARKWAVATAIHNSLGESMEDYKSGALVRPTDGVARYFNYTQMMRERGGSL